MMRRLLALVAIFLFLAIISMAQEGNDGTQGDNNMGIVEKNLNILEKLVFKISKNYYFAKGLNYGEYYIETFDEREKVNDPESQMHPNMMVDFYNDEKGNFQCDYVLWKPRWLELEKNNPKMNKYGVPTVPCGDGEIYCYHYRTLQEARYLKLPIIPYSYFPAAVLKDNPISNIADMYTTLNGLDAHDALRTCTSAYLFRGEKLSRGLHKLREDWILYLLQGYIGCELRLKTNKQNIELLEKGYTVTLRQIIANFDGCHEEMKTTPPTVNIDIVKSADLMEYKDMDRPNGYFLIGAVIGSAELGVNTHKEVVGSGEGVNCTMKGIQSLLQLKIKHHCSEEGQEVLTLFTFPFNLEDVKKMAPNGIVDWKEMYHNNKTTNDIASVVLKGPNSSQIQLPNGAIYNGTEPGGDAKPDGGKKFKKEL